MVRVWRLDDGTAHEDRIPRRVLPGDRLADLAAAAGFRPVGSPNQGYLLFSSGGSEEAD
jgi:hypothetical protein